MDTVPTRTDKSETRPACSAAPVGTNAPRTWRCTNTPGHQYLHHDDNGGTWGDNTFTRADASTCDHVEVYRPAPRWPLAPEQDGMCADCGTVPADENTDDSEDGDGDPVGTNPAECSAEYPNRTVLYWPETKDAFSALVVRDDTAASDLNLEDEDAHWFVPNDQAEQVYTWAGLLDWLAEEELTLDEAVRTTLGGAA